MAKWKPGQSGNYQGRPRKLGFDDFLREALLTKDGEVVKRLIERLIGEGAKGNLNALKLIAERTCGRPESTVDVALKNGDELTLEQVRAKLAEFLSRPAVKENIKSLLASSDDVDPVVQ